MTSFGKVGPRGAKSHLNPGVLFTAHRMTGILMMSILQRRKLRFREGEGLAQGLTAG